MFGLRHSGRCEERWGAGRGWRGRHGGGFGWGGRHGTGGGDMMRAGRMLAQGDLRLIALALIAEQPRHGYEIIKLLEDKTEGWYSPSPGIVYPTLTYLEDAGYVTAQAEGSKKLYAITDQGKAHLEDNRDFVDAVMERLGTIGERAKRMREHFERPEYDGRRGRERGDRDGPRLTRMVRAALEDLRDEAGKRLEANADDEAKIVELLTQLTAKLRGK
jgi:DNA-binding PadR family transcriptional regulator